MIETEFDKPADMEIKCMICSGSLKVTHHWIRLLDHWMHPTCHNRCVENWSKTAKEQVAREIPERFQNFDATKVPDTSAIERACEFTIDSGLKTLAIVGPRGSAKT